MHRPPDTRCNGTNCTAGKAVPAALGLSTARWVEERLGGYVRLSVEERREAVKELTAAKEEGGEGLSTRQAAAVLGVDHKTVVNDRRAGEFSPAPGLPSEQVRAVAGENSPPEVAPPAPAVPEEPDRPGESYEAVAAAIPDADEVDATATEEPVPELPEAPAPTRRQERRSACRNGR